MDENNVTATAVTGTEPAVSAAAPDAAPVGDSGASGVDEDVILPPNWKPDDGEKAENPEKPSPEDANLYRLFGLNPDGAEKGAENPETPENTEPKPESVTEDAEPPKQETEPDYKAMYEQLLRSTQDAKGRETFRQVYAEQKAAGMSDAAARLVAKDAAGGKEFSLTDDAETPSGNAGNPDYAAALNQLHSAFPDVKDIPAEVTKAMMDGGDPVVAYMSYQRAQDRKTIGELQAKIRDMEQKASNTVRAVARGVSGNGAKQEAIPPFLQGMMDEDW
ncbi:MAG: hypothetical protein IJQ81_11110 [Oscillibacter sp.]|nr:hypothetical protein [Oscillibacter sp.]